jgi:hypothetical protein
MVDIETLDTRKSSVILQIGAAYFDRYTGEVGDKYSVNIDLKSSLASGFTVNADTIYWWMKQAEEARKSVFEGEAMHVFDAINDFNRFAEKAKFVWSHATFDFNIIYNHFEKLNIVPTFHYRTARDIRTLIDLADINFTEKKGRSGTRHTALDDVLYQIEYCVIAFNTIKGKIENSKPKKDSSGLEIKRV